MSLCGCQVWCNVVFSLCRFDCLSRTLKRILDAFREFRVGSHVFAGVDGYGHGDIGRETLDKVYACLFGSEAAMVGFESRMPNAVLVHATAPLVTASNGARRHFAYRTTFRSLMARQLTETSYRKTDTHALMRALAHPPTHPPTHT